MDELIPVLEETNRLLSQHFQNNTSEWVSIIISLVALFCAFFVPKRIASRQDKIALFEKRFEAYSNLLKVDAFADTLKSEEFSMSAEVISAQGNDLGKERSLRAELILFRFGMLFGCHVEKRNDLSTVHIITTEIQRLEVSLQTLPLLYGKKFRKKSDAVSQEIRDIIGVLMKVMADVLLDAENMDDQNREDFISLVDNFVKKYADIFEHEVKI